MRVAIRGALQLQSFVLVLEGPDHEQARRSENSVDPEIARVNWDCQARLIHLRDGAISHPGCGDHGTKRLKWEHVVSFEVKSDERRIDIWNGFLSSALETSDAIKSSKYRQLENVDSRNNRMRRVVE